MNWYSVVIKSQVDVSIGVTDWQIRVRLGIRYQWWFLIDTVGEYCLGISGAQKGAILIHYTTIINLYSSQFMQFFQRFIFSSGSQCLKFPMMLLYDSYGFWVANWLLHLAGSFSKSKQVDSRMTVCVHA